MSTKRPIFATFAVSRTGNRGAVSMLESAIDYITSSKIRGAVNVFTVYPKQDQTAKPRSGVTLYNGTPANLVFRLIPLCLIYRLSRQVHFPLPVSIFFGGSIKGLIESDVCLLIGGTTFSDAQLLKVIYNVICALPSIILGKKSMMYSQTMGPFKRAFNRFFAKFCLLHSSVVAPRGQTSFENVRDLGIPNATHIADSAFTLDVSCETERAIREKYMPILEGKTVVGISTNTIVERKCRKLGIDHTGIWIKFIEYLRMRGYYILLVPHSMRLNSKSRHNNDLLTIKELLDHLPSHDGLHVVDDHLDCKELRVVVGLTDYYIASRFHSMISALCTETPVCVFGWGFQKYREVLYDFELEEYCYDASELSVNNLIKGFEAIVDNAENIREKIRKHLPAVRDSSQQNHLQAMRLADAACRL